MSRCGSISGSNGTEGIPSSVDFSGVTAPLLPSFLSPPTERDATSFLSEPPSSFGASGCFRGFKAFKPLAY